MLSLCAARSQSRVQMDGLSGESLVGGFVILDEQGLHWSMTGLCALASWCNETLLRSACRRAGGVSSECRLVGLKCAPGLLRLSRSNTDASFDDNACVLLNNKGEMLGTRVNGVVAAELRNAAGGTDANGRWSKILQMAPKVSLS